MIHELSTTDDCVTPNAIYAREHGYEVHHDHFGWYVIRPHEVREGDRNKRGVCLGSTRGREHFAHLEDAWRWAAEFHRRKLKRKPTRPMTAKWCTSHQRHDGCHHQHPIIV